MIIMYDLFKVEKRSLLGSKKEHTLNLRKEIKLKDFTTSDELLETFQKSSTKCIPQIPKLLKDTELVGL